MIVRNIALNVLFLLAFLNLGYAQGQATQIRVANGKVTEVAFPQAVAKVIKGGAVDSLLVEVVDKSVYLLPKSDISADIFITTISGQSYPLHLVVADKQDVKVSIDQENVDRISQGSVFDSMGIMKDLLRGQIPQGASEIPGKGQVLLDNGNIQLNVKQVYEFPQGKAYILYALNLKNNGVIVPVQSISFPGLVAIASDSDFLNPKGQSGDQTQVYLVCKGAM